MAPDYSPATFGGDSRPIHGDLLELIWPLALVSPFFVLTHRDFWSKERRGKLAVFALSYAAVLWVVFADPAGLGSWAAD